MSHKDAPPETPEQVRMREFYRARGASVGWGRAKDGSYLAPFARDAWAAWQEAQRSAHGGSILEQIDRMNASIEAFAIRDRVATMKFSDLQARLPWVLPYSEAFYESQDREGHRNLMHDLLHVYKSLGRVAAMAEKIDHGKDPGMTVDELAHEVADLVICALHIANTNPLGGFSLHGAVLTALNRRNGSSLTDQPEAEVKPLHTLLLEARDCLRTIGSDWARQLGARIDAAVTGAAVQPHGNSADVSVRNPVQPSTVDVRQGENNG